MRKIFFFLSIFLFCCLKGFSQPLPFRTYSIEKGLSEAVVQDMMQDNQGYIWIATNYGLNRFDGIKFKNYYEKNGLLSNKIYSLYQDGKNRIWVGTGGGVNIIKDDSIQSRKVLKPLTSSTILDINQDKNNNFWFATNGQGVWRWNGKQHLKHYTTAAGLVNNEVNAIATGSNGVIWFGTNGGLSRLNLSTGKIQSFTKKNGLPNNTVYDIKLADQGKTLWIGTDNGLCRFSNGKFKSFTTADGLINNSVRSLSLAPDGSLWLGTEKGAAHFKNGKFTNYTAEEGLPNNVIYATLADREDNIWFGTFGGGVGVYLNTPVKNYSIKQGLPNSVVTSITQDASGDHWVGTDGGGLARLHNGHIRVFDESDGLVNDNVYDVVSAPEGRLLIGTRRGFSVFQHGKFTNYREPELPYHKIKNITVGNNPNEWWLGTYGKGIIKYKDGKFTLFDKKNGLSNNTTLGVLDGPNGSLWIASYGGVSRFKNGHFTNYTIKDGLPSNGVLDIAKANDGSLWFATFGGIARFKNGHFTSITPADGLPDEVCYFIIQDNKGDFWIGTNKGVIRFNFNKYQKAKSESAKAATFKLYTRAQGLIANEMNAGAAFKDRNGVLWFGSVNGLIRFNPAKEKNHSVPPLIHIDKVMISQKNITNWKNLVIPSDDRNITINFVGINFSAPKQLVYQYRLKGSGEGWQQTKQRRVHYSALNSGTYTFQVKAKNGDGVWSKSTAALYFKVRAPFWFRWWFILLMGLVLAGIILFIYHYFRVRQMVDIERMRVRIASDLHDDVGSSLTEIALQSDFLLTMDVPDDLKDSLRNIGEQSRKIVSSLDDIVWSIDARNDTVGDLTDRMQDYVNNTLSDRKVEYHFENLNTDQSLSVSLRENLYLIFKEAINNIAKHSNATKVDIYLISDGNSFNLKIDDNGTDVLKRRKTGNGLRNMKMRGKRINGSVNFQDEDGFTVEVQGQLE